MIDRAILADLFDRHAAQLVLYARQWLDRALAEDAVQEIYVRLAQQRTPPANPKAWLYRATRNQAISLSRSSRRRQRHEEFAATDEPWFEPDAPGWIDGAAARAAMESLPDSQREVIVLRIWGQMTLKEIATVTGSSTSTVFDQYRAGLTALRTAMGANCENPRKHRNA
ncbi:MAG TPA: sigma-70 family RNA polymerase sigma factor [Humisphaera sp.]|jgi:RNA polymerase sigma-70 factor (ECF subfamily)|nr:sigma-70 family RNA polymerase sigma factor [Humisphaera sp.]